MTKIGIIGATGHAGSAIYKEANTRGHDVTAIVRNKEKAYELLGKNVQVLEKDAFALTKTDLADFDVIVDAFATSMDQAYRHVDLATKLIAMFRENKTTRLFFILGAGSLLVGTDNHLNLDDLKKLPDSEKWIAVPENQYLELKFLRDVNNVNWVGFSPSMDFKPGAAKTPVLGKDHLLYNSKGHSVTSTGTMAVAMLNEIEQPTINQTRITVLDQE